MYTGAVQRESTASRATKIDSGGRSTSDDSSTVPCRALQPEVGYMVAFKDDGEVHIGKVAYIGPSNTLLVSIYQGTLNGTWTPATYGSKSLQYTVTVEQDSIIENLIFYLTNSGRLPGRVKEKVAPYFLPQR